MGGGSGVTAGGTCIRAGAGVSGGENSAQAGAEPTAQRSTRKRRKVRLFFTLLFLSAMPDNRQEKTPGGKMFPARHPPWDGGNRQEKRQGKFDVDNVHYI